MKAAFTQHEANVYLGLGPRTRWLTEPGCPVPRVDLRKVGACRPVWRWLQTDLDAFLQARRVEPGRRTYGVV